MPASTLRPRPPAGDPQALQHARAATTALRALAARLDHAGDPGAVLRLQAMVLEVLALVGGPTAPPEGAGEGEG